jgi:hypothetical protein
MLAWDGGLQVGPGIGSDVRTRLARCRIVYATKQHSATTKRTAGAVIIPMLACAHETRARIGAPPHFHWGRAKRCSALDKQVAHMLQAIGHWIAPGHEKTSSRERVLAHDRRPCKYARVRRTPQAVTYREVSHPPAQGWRRARTDERKPPPLEESSQGGGDDPKDISPYGKCGKVPSLDALTGGDDGQMPLTRSSV